MAGNPEQSEIAEKYGNRVRMRSCGLCWRGNSLLMVNHRFITKGDFWAPPGGGVEFGQSALDALVREFKEETAVAIKPGKLLFTCELLKHPLHSVELFFEAHYQSGEPITGSDPESEPGKQIIKEVKFLEFDAIMSVSAEERHGVFRFVRTIEDLKKLSGFYRI
jgi:8-oxo-dGTP diphosphatase